MAPALRFSPGRSHAYRVPVLLAVLGRNEEAERLMRAALHSHPQQYEDVVRHALARLAEREPVRIAPLAVFAEAEFAKLKR